jgi:hypothetical protein
VSERFTAVVARNFVVSALLVGLGLARVTVDGMFAHLQPAGVAYLLFIGGVLCPVAWLLGQTVPVLTNLMKHVRTGEASGYALYWSTLGSFLGSVSLALLVMQWLGVSAAVLVCASLLAAGSLLLGGVGWRPWAAALAAGLGALGINLFPPSQVADTAYADYTVEAVNLPDHTDPGPSSSTTRWPPWWTTANRRAMPATCSTCAASSWRIWPCATRPCWCWGPAASPCPTGNRPIATPMWISTRRSAGSPKRAFSRRPSAANSSWMTRGVTCAPPPSASTRWWWMSSAATPPSPATWSPGVLAGRPPGAGPGGVLLANLILDGKLETPYARNLLATIESVFGRCGVEVLHRGKPLSNVIVSCHASSRPAGVTPYSDERNGADVDLARSLRGLSGAIDSGQ